MATPRTSQPVVTRGPAAIAGSIPILLNTAGASAPTTAARVIEQIIEPVRVSPKVGSPFCIKEKMPTRIPAEIPMIIPTKTSRVRVRLIMLSSTLPMAKPRVIIIAVCEPTLPVMAITTGTKDASTKTMGSPGSLAMVEAFAGKVPLLGVCLGHQCIVQHFGGEIIAAGSLMHGKTSWIEHDGCSLYRGLPSPFEAGRYHSLAANRLNVPDELQVTATTNTHEIMGVRHHELPIEGVQFHPESVLTPEGPMLLENFLYSDRRAR